MSRLSSDPRGLVFVEFLVISIPLLMLILGTMQLALLYAARLATEQAARSAARAAMVVLDDHPDRYGGEPRLAAPSGSQRHQAIRRAALIPLLSVVRPTGLGAGGTEPDDLYQIPPELAQAVEVTLPDSIARGERITGEVAFAAPCGIPLGRLLLCHAAGGTRRVLRARATVQPHTY